MSRRRGGNAHIGAELKSLVERLEKLDQEKQSIQDDIREVKKEASDRGFDIPVINQILKDRRKGEHERRDFEAKLQLYRASLGMLDGTPLGEHARKRLDEEPKQEASEAKPEDGNPIGPEQIAAAREVGQAAAREGKRIIDNPYTANDPRRAAWDEGWCAETGTDGMEVPKAWRRKDPKEKKEPAPDGEPEGGAS